MAGQAIDGAEGDSDLAGLFFLAFGKCEVDRNSYGGDLSFTLEGWRSDEDSSQE